MGYINNYNKQVYLTVQIKRTYKIYFGETNNFFLVTVGGMTL